jgi:hypothetical protein
MFFFRRKRVVFEEEAPDARCKLEPQGDTTSHIGMAIIKKAIIRVGEDMEKL